MKEKYQLSWKNITIHLDFSRWFWKKQSVKSFLLERLTEILNLFYRALGFILGMYFVLSLWKSSQLSIIFVFLLAIWLMFDVKFDFHVKKGKEA